eukprot:10990061-Ditylum_brightwellii.AAC.1
METGNSSLLHPNQRLPFLTLLLPTNHCSTNNSSCQVGTVTSSQQLPLPMSVQLDLPVTVLTLF